MIDRRNFIVAAAAGLCTPAFAGSPSLRSLAAEKGLAFGAIIGTSPIGAGIADFDDPAYRHIIETECQVIVPENEMKMAWTWQGPATYNFAGADTLVSYAGRQKMDVRGHNLLWSDNYTPKWLLAYDFGSKPALKAETMLRDYVAAVCDHFGNRIASWDVVNEAVDPETGALRSTVFTRLLGEDAIRIVFEAAREHLPQCQLVYNDFMSWSHAGGPHRDGVLALLRRLADKNVPVDGLGLQSHLGLGFELSDSDPDGWGRFLDDTDALGLDLLITEFDVNDGGLSGGPASRDQAIARVAGLYLDQALSYKALKTVICWGLVDKYSWISAYMPRGDKQEPRPTPFDSAYQPKPLYTALASAFRSASPR